MASNSTQISAAAALLQLLQENPGLPEAGWSIGSVIPELRGFVHEGGMGALVAYQDVIGGSVRAANCYESAGRQLRRHLLTAVWRDVPVEVVIAVPVKSLA